MSYIKFKFPLKLGKGYQFAKGIGVRDVIIHNSGKRVQRKYNDDMSTSGYDIKYLVIKTEKSGRHYIQLNKPSKKIYVDEMVAYTFCHRPLGSTHFIHVNGDIGDDYCGNIKWVSRLEYIAFYRSKHTKNVDGEDYVLFGDDCYISQKGIVIDSNDKVRTIHTSVSDSDMGCFRACPPYVLGESGKTHRIEEMMSEVWLNQSISQYSKDVYHKNGNICDNDLSNLEIVEYNTPEAKVESENWKKWKDAENIRISGHI